MARMPVVAIVPKEMQAADEISKIAGRIQRRSPAFLEKPGFFGMT